MRTGRPQGRAVRSSPHHPEKINKVWGDTPISPRRGRSPRTPTHSRTSRPQGRAARSSPHHPPAPASPSAGKRGRKNRRDAGDAPGFPGKLSDPATCCGVSDPATCCGTPPLHPAKTLPRNPAPLAHWLPAGPGVWGCPPSSLFFSPFPKRGEGGQGVGDLSRRLRHCTPSAWRTSRPQGRGLGQWEILPLNLSTKGATGGTLV